ncbi:MAG: enoyl-CoA hydratase [Rubellimicrobium sp.]|nr:enoyl-CoA hydratase [Rubellimicrobium sp.]
MQDVVQTAFPTRNDTIRAMRDGHVATVTLNRPESLNALSGEMIAALSACLDDLAAESRVRVVVLRGAGAHFCAGHDLAQMTAHRGDGDGGRACYRRLFADCSAMMQRIRSIPQPVIACVRGVATASGCQLVAACDLAIAAEDARFATSGVRLGLFCSTPLVELTRTLAPKHAMELLCTGAFIDARQAEAIGLVNRAVPEARLDDEVAALAATIAAHSPLALATGKRLAQAQAGMTRDAAYALAAETMADNMMSADAEAGIGAFLSKRPLPEWTGA